MAKGKRSSNSPTEKAAKQTKETKQTKQTKQKESDGNARSFPEKATSESREFVYKMKSFINALSVQSYPVFKIQKVCEMQDFVCQSLPTSFRPFSFQSIRFIQVMYRIIAENFFCTLHDTFKSFSFDEYEFPSSCDRVYYLCNTKATLIQLNQFCKRYQIVPDFPTMKAGDQLYQFDCERVAWKKIKEEIVPRRSARLAAKSAVNYAL